MTFFLWDLIYSFGGDVMKRFVARKRYNFRFIKVILVCLCFVIGFGLIVNVLFKRVIKKSDGINVNELLAFGSNNLIGNISFLDIINFNLSAPDNLIKMAFEKNKEKPVVSSSKPVVYIYNTHQSEEYARGSLAYYNITPTVYMAANILKKELDGYGISSIVEDSSIKEILNDNGWKYNQSYYASKLCLENAKKRYDSLNYFIDVHRDSVSKVVEINDVKYARMMFVVGMNHDGYEENSKLVVSLNNYLNEHYDGLMRDILYSPKNKYNQNFHHNTLLVEIGGPDNTIDEVYNSVLALSEAFYYVIGDKVNGGE